MNLLNYFSFRNTIIAASIYYAEIEKCIEKLNALEQLLEEELNKNTHKT